MEMQPLRAQRHTRMHPHRDKSNVVISKEDTVRENDCPAGFSVAPYGLLQE